MCMANSTADAKSDSKHFVLEDGATLPYDSLIVARGSQTSYFGARRMAGVGGRDEEH
jgi:NADH dehydrogenase FAD-containing subunit